MSRTQAQINRLGIERNLLDRYFPNRVTWQNPTTLDTRVEIVMTSNSNRQYSLRVYIPVDFPHSCPEMVVVSPRLTLKDGTPMPSVSEPFHTIGEKEGHVIICHFIPTSWESESTLFQVFMKGRLWLEGYEGHLRTGQDMDVFLKHQREEIPPNNVSVIFSEIYAQERTTKCRCVLM